MLPGFAVRLWSWGFSDQGTSRTATAAGTSPARLRHQGTSRPQTNTVGHNIRHAGVAPTQCSTAQLCRKEVLWGTVAADEDKLAASVPRLFSLHNLYHLTRRQGNFAWLISVASSVIVLCSTYPDTLGTLVCGETCCSFPRVIANSQPPQWARPPTGPTLEPQRARKAIRGLGRRTRSTLASSLTTSSLNFCARSCHVPPPATLSDQSMPLSFVSFLLFSFFLHLPASFSSVLWWRGRM